MNVEKESLMQENLLKCPRCKNFHSVEQYQKLKEAEEFDHETVPIYKCPSCKWIFALAIIPPELYDEILNFFKKELAGRLVRETGASN